MKLNCLIVDDESLARKLMEENVRLIPFLELVATCKNAFEAIDVMQSQAVDLIFLDIQMPGMLGTQFLQSLIVKPLIILVTAYANYAVESYDLQVVDYLLKPVSVDRFTKAAYKALEEKLNREARLQTQLIEIEKLPDNVDSFFVNVEYALVKITVSDISHVESMRDYVKIYLTSAVKPVITKSTLKSIEEKLPPRNFLRVHKSFLINVDKINSIRNQNVSIGEHFIPVSDAHIETLMQFINH